VFCAVIFQPYWALKSHPVIADKQRLSTKKYPQFTDLFFANERIFGYSNTYE